MPELENRGMSAPLARPLLKNFALGLAALLAPAFGQTNPTPAPAAEEAVVLSPFEVNSSKDVGYVATSSLAGGRTEMSLKHTAAAISVFTREFLDDIGSESLTSVAMWGLNMDPKIDGNTGLQGEYTVNFRGLGSSFPSRNYFVWYVDSDSYVTERYEFADVFRDVAEVVRSDYDAVHLVSGIPDHAPQALAMLNAGKHCACTVPMATTLDDLHAIVAAEKRTGLTYMMMETAAYTYQCLYTEELIQRGEVGRIQLLRGAHYQDMENWPPYWLGLPPMHYATHAVAPLLKLANTRATRVHCFGSGSMRTTVEALNGSLPGLVLPWTRDLLCRWRRETGRDLLPMLPALLYEVGPDWQQTRLDFYDACTRWYLGAYHGAISGWCSRRGIEYIGHTLEEPLWGQIRTQGNQTRVLEQFHRPGLDYLMTGIGSREHPHRILSVKCASSVAHVQGKPRVAVEAFGGSGHGHSLAARKLDAAFMAVLGVNMYIPHAFYYSFDGYRKTDWPPTEFYHAPHWPHYKAFADFLARLSLVQSSGTHLADVALLSPVRSAQTRIFHGGQCTHALPEDAAYAFVSDRLLRRHIDYDYLDDSQLHRAEARAGRLRFAASHESYPTVVMPLCRVLSPTAAARIRELYLCGGNVMAIGCVPDTADDGDHLSVQQAMAALFGPEPEAEVVRTSAAGGSAAFVRDWERRDDVIAALLTSFAEPVAACLAPDGSSAQDVLVSVRSFGEAAVCMVVNTLDARQRVSLSVRRPGPAAEWDVETGAVRPLASATDDRGLTTVGLELGPQACRIVAMGAGCEEHGAAARPAIMPMERCLALPAEWSFTTREPNVLPLDRWECSLRDRAASAAERQGVAGQVNVYTSRFVARRRPASLRLVLDNLKQWVPPHMGFLSHFRSLEVYINGRQLPPLVPSDWQDPHYLMQEIADAVAVGINTVEIRAISSLEPMHGLLDPAYLVGDFGLADGEMVEPAAAVTGLWTDAGRPFYSGIGVYERTLEAPAEAASAAQVILRLGEVRDGAAVTVNGQVAGTRLWQPFEVDLTGLLRPGANALRIEVWNSLANLYDREVRPSGLGGPVELIWRE